MTYHTVFDVAAVGFQGWKIPAIALGTCAISLACLGWRDRLNEILPVPISKARLYAAAFLGGAIGFGAFLNSFGSYRANVSALQSGAVTVVAGEVHDFSPKMSEARGTPPERFCVQRQCFEYSGFGPSYAFGQTRIQGGPIRDGLRVRVTSLNGKILRLEIAGGVVGR
jgi:hypothetical protein